jgi:hypothetical protein
VRERAGRILTGGVSQVVKGLRQIVTKRRLTGTKAKTLRGTADYFYANYLRALDAVHLASAGLLAEEPLPHGYLGRPLAGWGAGHRHCFG